MGRRRRVHDMISDNQAGEPLLFREGRVGVIKLRKEHRYTQAEFARELGVSQQG